MNKNSPNKPFRGFSNKQSQESFDNKGLEHEKPNNEIVMSSDHQNMLKDLGLSFDSEFELIQKEIDSESLLTVPKDKTDREILDFEHFRQTIVCFYILYNVIHDKYYIGQTTNLERRIFDHIRDLDRRDHDNESLQIDFDNIKNQGLDPYKSFKVYTVQNTSIMRTYTSEESYILDLELRHIESMLIKKYFDAGYHLYNITGVAAQKTRKQQREKIENKSKDFYSITKELKERKLIPGSSLSPSSESVPVIIKGQEYKSITEAANELNMNRRHLYHCILSQRFPEFMTKEEVETGKLYVYFSKDRRINFKNIITGEKKIFLNASQCDLYLKRLKKEMNPETVIQYQKAGIFVDRKTLYRKLEKKTDPVFGYYSKEDEPEKVLVFSSK